MILPCTIKDGEAAALWSPKGTRQVLIGPKVVFAPLKQLQFLRRYLARDTEYLVVRCVDGTTEHLPGPCEQWFDPLLHCEMSVESAIELDAHECIIVYTKDEEEVRHRILEGPALFIPQPNEWLHEFSWHADDGHGRKRPRGLTFTRLRRIPDQMYYNVEQVRTSDEALITVQLMIFFELEDIERMLSQTHDPIADFINAATADVIRFAGSCDFESFKTEAAALNKLETYQELTSGAKRIGYRVHKVVYRGYLAPKKLQLMHDGAIETRTKLVLEAETEDRRQEIADVQQEREHERAARDRKEEQRLLDHSLEQSRLGRVDELTATREREELELLLRTQREELELTLTTKRHQCDEAHRRNLLEFRFEEWSRLQQAGADLTAVLVAQQRNPDKLIRLEQDGSSEQGIHLHEAI